MNDMHSLEQVNSLYSNVLCWVKKILDENLSAEVPLLIGINGPQGCGKSTLTNALVRRLGETGIRATSLSIDDFYLTHHAQIKLAASHPTNPYLQQRGYPGTHDIELGRATLEALKRLKNKGEVLCPVYDKSRYEGKGDRLPVSSWKTVSAPLDLILFEGWMLGFTPVSETLIEDEAMREVNHLLKSYEEWNHFFDGFIQLSPLDIHDVLRWRVEAEENMKLAGKPGMSKQEALEYIQKFILAYELYLPRLLSCPPLRENYLRLTLSKDRLPI